MNEQLIINMAKPFVKDGADSVHRIVPNDGKGLAEVFRSNFCHIYCLIGYAYLYNNYRAKMD